MSVLSFGDSVRTWVRPSPRELLYPTLFRVLFPPHPAPLALRHKVPHRLTQSCRERVSPHSNISTLLTVPWSFGPSGQVYVHMDPRKPFLAFLACALPEDHPELSSVLDNAEEHANKMNIPGAVSGVKVRRVCVQVPSENGVLLELMHRFQVEMEHNWYETTVTASLPHRIVDVVDWASASPMPLSVATEKGELLPNLVAFVPPGSNFDTVSSAPGLGGGPRFGEALAGKKAKKGCHAKEEGRSAAAPTLTQYPALLSCRSSSPPSEVFPWGVNDPVEAPQRKAERHGQTGDKPSTLSRTVVRPSRDTEEDSMAEVQSHIDATVTQLFYTSNTVHDLSYRCRFTEAAVNFEQYNFGKGGAEAAAGRTFGIPQHLALTETCELPSTLVAWAGVRAAAWVKVLETSSPPQCVPRLPATGASPPTAKAVSVTTFTLWTSLSTPRPTKPLDKPGYWSIRAIGEEMLWVVQQRSIATYGFSGSQFHDT
ncbi:hypothetical protein PAXINDRAFT_16814 [Paxillus involutus ATCC 200175]|uniref:Extracellular metalloproteinase n=1 Tax=Paxillus involutus ATCC 200175 TaxID=664439 RepID=A0A0C9T3L8_PAXIN|nr:hypothetical protein PAXINDRAFT_16814 [Paxillus involutus ATCC 200175]